MNALHRILHRIGEPEQDRFAKRLGVALDDIDAVEKIRARCARRLKRHLLWFIPAFLFVLLAATLRRLMLE